MIIRRIQEINAIIPLHEEIFNRTFPISSYYKKCKTNELYIFVYEEESRLIGYSIIVDQKQEKICMLGMEVFYQNFKERG